MSDTMDPVYRFIWQRFSGNAHQRRVAKRAWMRQAKAMLHDFGMGRPVIFPQRSLGRADITITAGVDLRAGALVSIDAMGLGHECTMAPIGHISSERSMWVDE